MAGMARDAMMPEDFHVLKCNWACKDGDCKNATDALCWITTCQHVLCDEHARLAFANGDTCPICGYEGAKVMRVSREGRDQARKGLLPGLTPSEIMDSAARNIEFWVRQKALECEQRHERCLQMEKRCEEMSKLAEEQMQTYQMKCQQMEDIQLALQKKLDVLEADRNRAQLRIQTLQKDCSEAEMRYQHVQRQIRELEGVLRTSTSKLAGLQPRPAPSLPISEERRVERGVERGVERHVDTGKSFNLEGAWRSTAMSPGCPMGASGAGAMAMAMGHFSQPRKEVAPGSPKRVMQPPPPRFTPGYLSSARMTRRRIT